MGLVGEEGELEIRSESTLLSGKVGPSEMGAEEKEEKGEIISQPWLSSFVF